MTVCECCGNDESAVAVCLDCAKESCDHGNGSGREDVFLVAFCVADGKTRDDAQDTLIAELLRSLPLGATDSVPAHIQEWWVAEDDRRDGSDNDSAEFVPFSPSRTAQGPR